jgi:hypothetical protein
VVWQHVLGVACVLCAVQNGTELGGVFFVGVIFVEILNISKFNK